MKIKGLTICIFVGFLHCVWGQIKIGENPQQLHPASVLELESTDRALIFPRVDQSQMEAITPLAGALVYNTTVGSVYYFEGRSWVNLGSDNQQLRLNQGLLTLEDGGQPIDLSAILASTEDNQNLGPAVLINETLQLTIENGEGVLLDLSPFALDTDLTGFLTEELDDDPTNELELPDDSAATNGDVLITDGDGNYSWTTPSSGGGTDTNDFVSAGNLNGQNLVLTGTGAAGATVDLSAFALDTDLNGFLTEELDEDPTNELELPDDSAATNGDVLITDGSGNYSWTTPTSGGGTDTNDFVSAGNLNGQNLVLTGTGTAGATIDLSPFALDTDLTGFLTEELDDDPTNELELPDDSAATNGDVLITDGDGNYSWTTPTSGGGTDTNDFVSAGNLNGQNLVLTGTGTAGATIDLSPFALDTDLTGFLTEELDDDPTNELELPDDSAATNGDVLITDGSGNYSWTTPTSGGGTDTNDFVSAGNLNGQNLVLTGTGTAGATIDLSPFALDTDLNGFLTEELDDDPTNELELPDDSTATNGDVLITDGDGNYSWTTPTSGGGTDTNDFVSAGNLNGQNLVLTGTGTAGATVDLSAFALDTDLNGFLTEELDDDPTNELELPDDSAATNGDVLITDGSGNYSWTTPTSGGGTDTNDFVSAGNLNGQNLVLTGTGAAGATVDLSAFALDSDLNGFLTIEVDGDTTNELQNANEVPITDSANHFMAENVETALAELATSTGNMASTDLVLNTSREHDLAGNNLVFSGAGNIGIGNLPGAPQNKLDVSGQIRARNGFASTGGTANNPGYGFYTNNDSNTGMFRAAADQIGLTTGGTEAIRIDNTQNVGIGTDNPAEKLHVIGNILASGTITPDYVFEKYFTGYSTLKPSYKMLNLFELEQYIKKHLHLPGMPSAKKVEQQGGLRINLATERNLEKIEELYLHTISQHKKIMELQKKNQRNELELRILKSELQALKSYVLTLGTKNE